MSQKISNTFKEVNECSEYSIEPGKETIIKILRLIILTAIWVLILKIIFYSMETCHTFEWINIYRFLIVKIQSIVSYILNL